MAVQLFKAGTGEVGVFNEYSYLHLLDEGWHYTAEECYAEEKDQEEIEPETTAEEKTDEPEERVLSEDDNIRARAKAAGISHSWMKSISTLKNELRELSNAEYGIEN